MRKILILAYSDLNHDARITRQINFLSEKYQVTIACFASPSIEKQEILHLNKIKPGLIQKAIGSILLLSGFFKLAYNLIYDFPELRKKLKNREFDLIIANDIESLPLAFKIKKKEKILFDAHEFAPRHFEDKLVWRIFFQRFNKYLCKKYLPLVDVMTTVGKGLANEYAKQYPVKPIVLTNANYHFKLSPKEVDEKKIRIIHHGAANPSRKLETMIQMMSYLDDRFVLDLMLLTPTIANYKTRAYLDSLKRLIKNDSRIAIIPPVKGTEVVKFIHSYDIGVFLIPPINFNYANTLPNKLFDFIQAKLAIAIGPTPEMADIVNTYNLGVVSDDFTPQSLAKKINLLTAREIFFLKNQSEKASNELSAEKNKMILNDIVESLLSEKN
jgi:molybdopterin converting factor small subunit